MAEYTTIAAVDLGSNSFHCQIARVDGEQSYPLDGLREAVRLGAGLDDEKMLDDASQARAIAALQRFASTLKPYWRGILSRVRWPMHTGKLEGINNRIKLIKRMAYGYRDTEFFFLKIKAAFPGNP